MPSLENFPTAKQEADNSCWACTGREISNWYHSQGMSGSNVLYTSDLEFAMAAGYTDVSKMESAAQALYNLGYNNNTDDHPLPQPHEISDAISCQTPLLSIVGTMRPPHDKPNLEYKKGHWVVIVGISDDHSTINVFDPADGIIHTVQYNAAEYRTGVYWQNTSYVDAIKAESRNAIF